MLSRRKKVFQKRHHNFKKCVIIIRRKRFRRFFLFHIMKQNETNFAPKSAVILLCETCDFKCCKKSDYMRHMTTRKHQKNDKWITLDDKKAQKNAEHFECLCGKKYI